LSYLIHLDLQPVFLEWFSAFSTNGSKLLFCLPNWRVYTFPKSVDLCRWFLFQFLPSFASKPFRRLGGMGVDALMAELLFSNLDMRQAGINLFNWMSSDIKAKTCKFVKTLPVNICLTWVRALFQKLKVDIHISF